MGHRRNEYVDILNGFGQTAFGHGPDFVVEAVKDRLERGFAIGPQTDLAGEAAALFCELTGNERVTFCNTGSEAVMAALRIARTVTSRDRIVVFSGAYHGQFDEVLVTAGARGSGRAAAVAPGIPAESVSNVVVLDYGDVSSLAWIREHASELAAVVVEPVQSRHPALQPKAFLEELRAITAAAGTALVFDEVVTGFRMHPGGMQALFGIRADLATYGKVAGGGLPIGILAGTARFMDALDGGMWQYGDDSVPEVAPTFFAGTFVRHPLVMAGVLAVLRHVRDRGPELQEALTRTTAGLVERLNADLARRGITGRIETCGSLFYFNLSGEERLASLLYYHLRERGVYIQEGFPCFLTTAHGAEEVELIARAFSESLDALQAVGIFGFRELEIAPTESQTEVWLAAQLGDEASCAFNESVTLRFASPPDESALTTAWASTIARYDVLRGSFGRTGETMTIAPARPLAFATHVVDDGSDDAFEADLAAFVARDACTPFDLEDGPLCRGTFVRSGERIRALVFTAHHIVCDGWSINALLADVAAFYDGVRSGMPAVRPDPMPFAAYARAEREREPAERERVETFWRERFADVPAPLELPTDRPRTALRSFNGATRTAFLDAATSLAIKKAGARNGCTLFVTLLGAFAALVGRLANQRDIVVGVPTAGQADFEDVSLVGHCVNFLPIRTAWAPDTALADVLLGLKREMSDAYDCKEYTLGTLLRKLALPRDLYRLPLTEIQFNLERLSDALTFDGTRVAVEPNPKAFVNFDLFFNIIESDAGLRIDCDYNVDLFDATTIDRWLAYYRNVLDAIVRDSSVPVDRVVFVNGDETRALRSALDGRVAPYPSEATVHAMIERQVRLRPRAIALTCGDDAVTYEELDRRANRLAHELVARTGGSGLVGVALNRSVDLVVTLLATLKAGCAYVPLDPSHPVARLRSVATDAALRLIVTKGSIARDIWPVAATLDLEQRAGAIGRLSDRAPRIERSGSDLAYAIYTSGSTGMPKGVQIEHRAVVNLLAAMAEEPGLDAGDVLLAVTTVAFDIAALELFLPLTVGATVAIAPDGEALDGFRLLDRIAASRATAMQATPATWLMLLEAGFVPGATLKMLCGGEALSRELADRLLARGGELWNMYGPTETTIWSSCKRILADGSDISVGRPIRNTQFHILDGSYEPVPLGGTGELFIGGDGLARGYIGRPDLDAEKFAERPAGAGRTYRTGDLARLSPTGELTIIGRTDSQIKIRGFRIELGEIEATLIRETGVAAAAVVVREDIPGDARLAAYFVEREGRVTPSETLRATLADFLPEYMLPSFFVRLEALPLNANGKVDRSALPRPGLVQGAGTAFRAPETAIESALASIWGEVLQVERIGTTDDLFALGADSIHLFKIVARANRQGIRFAARELLKHRTISDLASHLDPDVVRA